MSNLTRSNAVVSESSKRQPSKTTKDIPANPLIKPTLKRYIILFLFGVSSGGKAFQWIQLPASTVKVTYYYGVENYVVNTLSVLFMPLFVVLNWPVCCIIKKWGLRNAVLLGSVGFALGAIVKCFSCYEGGIVLLFVGQTIVAVSEQFIFSVPSRLASVWFPDHQVSSAVAMCIFGNQAGNALGFIVPQIILNSVESKEEIGSSLFKIFVGLALVATFALISIIILFDEAPKFAPGAARLKQIEQEELDKEIQLTFSEEMKKIFVQSRELLRNGDFNILWIFYGIAMGSYYAIATVLNQMLELLWPGNDILIGNAGFIMVISGVLGLPLWGRLMDYLHRYLWINTFLTIATMLSFLLFAYVVSYMHSAYAIYLGTSLIGLFQAGIMVSALEFAVELTYPAPELITSSVMNVQPHVFAILLIYVASYIVDLYGAFAANLFFVSIYLLAFLMLPFIRETLKRQSAVTNKKTSEQQEKQGAC